MAREAYVMIIEEDPVIVNSITQKMELAGYQMTSAPDGWQASVQAQAIKIGLVISDIQEHGALKSVDAFSKLRQMSPGLPFIFMTSMKLDDAKRHVPAADAKVRLISKPINFEHLRNAIKDLTGLNRPL